MNEGAFFIAGGSVLGLILVALWKVGRGLGGPQWALAWLALFTAGYAALIAGESAFARFAYPLLGTCFVGCMIDGTLRFSDRVVPTWFWPVVLAAGVVRSLLQSQVPDVVAQIMGTSLIIAGSVYCVVVLMGSDYARNRRTERALAMILLLPAIAQSLYAWWRAQGIEPAPGLFTWLVIGMVVVAFQLVLLLGRTAERRARELAQQAEAALTHERSETARAVAGGFAHVFNNRLQPIIGYTELLGARDQTAGEAGVMLGRIREAAESCAEVTRTVLDYSDPLLLYPVQVRVAELIAPLQRQPSQQIQLDRSCETMVTADVRRSRDALEQVMRNAWESGASQVSVSAAAKHGYVEIVVEDNGRGVQGVDCVKVFEPFTSTKAPNSAAGLGLALTRSVVAAHGGYVALHPSHQGARVVLAFPKSDAGVPVAAAGATGMLPLSVSQDVLSRPVVG